VDGIGKEMKNSIGVALVQTTGHEMGTGSPLAPSNRLRTSVDKEQLVAVRWPRPRRGTRPSPFPSSPSYAVVRGGAWE